MLWKLIFAVEWVVDKTCPFWLRRWCFSHNWDYPNDVNFYKRIAENEAALKRRIRVMTDEELDSYIDFGRDYLEDRIKVYNQIQ